MAYSYGSDFGAVADEAVDAGRFCDAHVLRALSRSANYLQTQTQNLLNRVWPVPSSESAGAILCWTDEDIQIFHEYYEKRPGVATGTLHVYAKIDTGEKVVLTAETESGEATAEITGTGSYAWTALTSIPMTPGIRGTLRATVRGRSDAAPSGIGTPTSGSGSQVALSGESFIFTAGASSWSSSIATGGIILKIPDSPIGTRRVIGHESSAIVIVAPPFSDTEHMDGSDAWLFRAVPRADLGAVVLLGVFEQP